MKMNYSVLSIENGTAKLESEQGEIKFENTENLPADTKINDIIFFDGKIFLACPEETNKRKQTVRSLHKSLFE